MRDFTDFGVAFDNYHSTHSEENRWYAEDIYTKLQAARLIDTRSIEQYYDPVKEMFLPDRFIKGECPKCGAADQYGDNCEVCGAAYAPTELKNPYSAVSGAAPVLRNSDHYFFRLSDEEGGAFLREWTRVPTPTGAPAAARSGQQDEGVARRARREQALRLGHLARCALFRLRDPRRAGQILLCLAGCADRLLREFPQSRRENAATSTLPHSPKPARPQRPTPRWCTSSARTSSTSTPVLARDARVRRLPHAHQLCVNGFL